MRTTTRVSPPAYMRPRRSLTPIPYADSDDRAVLVALYNATDWENWVNKDNWLSGEPLGQWYGVTADGNGRVTELRLSENRLSGELPEGLGNLANLQVLIFGGGFTCDSGDCQPKSPSANRLAGEIPAVLGSLTNLERLQLSGNQLTGCIPQDLQGIPTNDLSELSLPFCDMPGAPAIATLTSTGETPPDPSLNRSHQHRHLGHHRLRPALHR